MSDERLESQWWYNDKTGAVEQGPVSPNRDRIGPFPTREGAAGALARVKANSENWAADDENA